MQIWLDDGIGRAEEQLHHSGGILRPGLELKLSRDDSQKLAKPPSLCPDCVRLCVHVILWITIPCCTRRRPSSQWCSLCSRWLTTQCRFVNMFPYSNQKPGFCIMKKIYSIFFKVSYFFMHFWWFNRHFDVYQYAWTSSTRKGTKAFLWQFCAIESTPLCFTHCWQYTVVISEFWTNQSNNA